MFVADRDNHTIRKITSDGTVSAVAGSAGSAGARDGKGPKARFFRPSGITVDGSGNLFVADTRNFTIRKISPAGVVSTIAGVDQQSGIKLGNLPGRLENTSGLAVIDSNTLVATERFSVLKILLNDRRTPSAIPASR